MATPWQTVTAVVLAGGDASDPVAAAFGVSAKALAPFRGKPIASYVLGALRASAGIGRVVYVGQPPEAAPPPDAVVPGGSDLRESLAHGLAAAEASEFILIVGADMPWLTPDALTRFLASAPDADLVYPAIPEAVAAAQFPGQRRTYARLLEGRFTGGNVALFKRDLAPRLLAQLGRAYAARKNPLALARLVGPDILLKLLLRRASIPELERRVGQLLGGVARLYVSPDACLGADVDEVEQLG